ncbi:MULTISPECIES: class I SAM-dependent methyltransferase [Pandoraea]|uniref:class I SAM-dependent methyltransferase n=1 Tax=Pandoraea TaxID=93217 RepID=UPI0003D22D80|nr:MULTISPECIES: class I SAM-dependent methyltransferase [Pandoraea]AHB76849.1 methyltransferase type 11 [Pandoraea pnomenusa]
MNPGGTAPAGHENIKQCCAQLYESDLARVLLGESFHPGGLALTERLGILLGLNGTSKVLDVACGKGASAIFLAERFGCEIVGIDYSAHNVEQAMAAAAAKGLAPRVRFQRADAERIPVDDGVFDAVVCECAFCTFPDKSSAAREFARVLCCTGAVGLSDLTRATDLPKELEGLLAWVACIADAQPLQSYSDYLMGAGFRVSRTEAHDGALAEMVHQIRMKLLGVEIMTGLKKLALPDVDLPAAKAMAQAALEAIRQEKLGYSIVCGVKS